MRLGVTGTREELTTAQHQWLIERIELADRVDHGACVGADEASHVIACVRGKAVTVHPPTNEKLMMEFTEWDYENCLWFPAADYHSRNREIVDNTDSLVALPNSPRRPHSGTWYTIDYANASHRPVLICYPSGRVTDGDGHDLEETTP